MSSNFPTSVDAHITNPTSTTREDVLSHAGEHDDENDQIHAIEVALGPTGTPGPLLTALAATSVTGPDAFGAGAVVGTSTQFARQDHDHGLPALDATNTDITTSAVGDTSTAGAVGKAADAGHKHGREAFATPVAIGQANTAGTATTLPHSDHVHQGVTSVTGGTGITVTGGDGSGHGAITLSTSSSSGALTQIAKTVLGSPAATITFSSIPGTYENLIVVVSGQSSDTGPADQFVAVQFNGDTAANYNHAQVYSTGTGAGANNHTGASFIGAGLVPSSAYATAPGICRIVVPGYARTTFIKSLIGDSWVDFGGTFGANIIRQAAGGEWNNTAAITSLTLRDGGGGNFVTGTVATLYGES